MDKNVDAMLDAISKSIEHISERQSTIDKKTKDSQSWKEANKHLMKVIKMLFITFGLVLVATVITIGFVVISVSNRYLDYEAGITREVVTETVTTETGESGVIIHGDGNNTTYGDGNATTYNSGGE